MDGLRSENVEDRAPSGCPAGVPAFRIEVAAVKMRAALWLGISFSVLSQCWI